MNKANAAAQLVRGSGLDIPVAMSTGALVEASTPLRYRFTDGFQLLPKTTSLTLNGTFADGEAERALVANKNWEVGGVNADILAATFATNGGMTLTTTTTSGDQAIASPLIESNVKTDGTNNATYNSPLQAIEWSTSKLPWGRFTITTPATMVSQTMWFGFKTTVDVNEDDDTQFGFRVVTNGSSAADWHVISNASASMLDTDTDIPIAASTTYVLDAFVDSSRYPHFQVGVVGPTGNLAFTYLGRGQRLPVETTLKPVMGVQTDTAAAKSVTVNFVDLSRNY